MAGKPHSFSPRQKMRTHTFEVFHYRDSHIQEVPLHHHDFYEVYFFLSGKVSYNVESRSFRLTPGDVLLISPDELHQPLFSGESQNYERVVLWINKSFLSRLDFLGQEVSRCFDTSLPGHTNLIRLGTGHQEKMYYLLQQLLEEQSGEQYAAELYGVSCLIQILVLLNRLAAQEEKNSESKAHADSVVYRVLGYINDHYSEDLSLDHLANRFFISKYHLSREFNRLVGTSVHRYIIQKRLVMAKQMMNSGVPASSVYQHCGFGDYSNFYRAFKSEYQISPKEFVATLRDSAFRGLEDITSGTRQEKQE